jgi:TatD DNase family protein
MLIDSHCHLDAAEFEADRAAVIQTAIAAGVTQMVVPAVCQKNFDAVIALRHQFPQCVYALGIHPMYVDQSAENDLQILSQYLAKFEPVAVGEIGLDYFVTKANIEKQIYFFTEQLKLAKQAHLPVILHVRNAIDDVLKYVRKYQTYGGIAHAFNGSFQQAQQFIDLGFKLGFGGAMTYDRALKIRELAKKLPLEAIVLETDAPDIPPAWLTNKGRNTPAELPRIAQILAEIRGVSVVEIHEKSRLNTQQVLTKTVELCT